MLFIYIAFLFLIFVMAIFKGKNMLFWSLGSYLVSSLIILASLLIYNIILSVNYSLQAGIFEKAGYYIVFHLKLHITDVVTIYNFGNFLLLSSSVIFLMISDKKITFKRILLFIPPVLYFYINHPRTKYLSWNYFVVHGYNNPFKWLVMINSILLFIYFIIPIIQLMYQYFKTRIFSKKKYALGTAIYILIIEISMGMVLHSSLYSNYYPLRFDVNSMPINKNINIFPLVSTSSKYTEISLVLAIVILLYILLGEFSSTFNIKPRRQNQFEQGENNEMMKIIFHSYKNAFFAIERFANILENSIDKNDETAATALENIKTISNTSYINSKKMTDSVILTYDFSQEKIRLNLNAFLSDLLLQYDAIKNLNIEKEFSIENIFVNASPANLKEAFTNIINNSVEAMTECEKPTIKVSLFTEGNSAVINFYDNGCGIDKKDIKNVFRPLFSKKNSSTNFGIGLSTALKTINYHSGTILCKSKPNEYTVFQVILPKIK